MINIEFKNYIKTQDLISKDFIDQSLEFWFNNREHIRSPFSPAIKKDIEEQTTITFMEWTWGLTEQEKKAITDEELVEMFEVILFNEAMKLTDDEDQRLTITYPFLPRVGDIMNDTTNGAGKITERKAVVNKDNKKYVELTIKADSNNKIWKTEFKLPV